MGNQRYQCHFTERLVVFFLFCSLIEGPFYCLSWQAEVSRTEKVQENLCSSVFSFGFLRKRFSKFSSWLGTSDKHWLHSFSILFIHAILVGVPSSWSDRFRSTMWMIFRFRLPVNLKAISKTPFRVLVLSIIINRQATPELGRSNEWDHRQSMISRRTSIVSDEGFFFAALHQWIDSDSFPRKICEGKEDLNGRTNDEPNRLFTFLQYLF